MKKIIPIAFIISLFFNGFLIYYFMVKGDIKPADQDQRRAIITSKENKDFVMAEMRGFLETIQEINLGLTHNNPEQIIKAAEKAGGAATEHIPTGLLKALPIEFKKLGFDTHDKFDQLAEAVRKKYNKEQTQEQLNGILSNCTSCHKSYKFETQP